MLSEQDNWLNPLNRIIWHKAFNERKTRVTIRDGRKFILDYDVPDFVIKSMGENIKVVHVRMAPLSQQPSWVETSFVPFGFFELGEVTNAVWITAGPSEGANKAIIIDAPEPNTLPRLELKNVKT